MARTKETASEKHAKHQKSLRRLIKEHNIHFYPISDRLPLSLQREQAAVQTIQNATYNENERRSSGGTIERMEKVWEAVLWCLNHEKNEDNWRRQVETKIFDPLTTHHACPHCKKRLWRADLEFPIGDEQGERWKNLRRRRHRRDKCTCKKRSMGDRLPKDRVFESLCGSTVRYGPDLQGKVSTGVRPDLVVGLFNSGKSTRLLDSPSATHPDKRVGEVIKSDIFVNDDADVYDDSGMIFPFLILEAKRARAPDSLQDMERQMALPAYEMLRTQKCLLENSTVAGVSNRLPRVWLVSFKAQTWKLYVATTEKGDNGESNYNIYNVWNGDVSGKEDALKLVLLLDCVFDWALDIYRLDIFESLWSMVAPTQSMNTPDIAPSVSDLSEAFESLGISKATGSRLPNLETIHEVSQDALKYKHGWIRDGRLVFIMGEGLLITETNIADIFDNFEHPDHAKRFARLVWALISRDAWLFKSEAILDKVREVWTGEKDKRQQMPETPIYVQVEVYVYFDINWQPTRKLIFVAATKDSIPEIFKRTKYPEEELHNFEMPEHQASEEEFLEELRDRRTPTLANDNLEEAISRWHCGLGSVLDAMWWISVSVPSCDKVFQEIFRIYQVGRKEPSESFLKIWHSPQPTVLSESVDEQWLIVGDTDERDWHHIDLRNRAPRLCVFVFDGLGDLDTSKIESILAFFKRQGKKRVPYDYTVLRGKYFSGSTHFDDNRPELESISRRGVISNSHARKMDPCPYTLLDGWIRGLDNGETDGPGSEDEEEYCTDDCDRRGDRGNSKFKEKFLDKGQDRYYILESIKNEETDTGSSSDSEEDEDDSNSEH